MTARHTIWIAVLAAVLAGGAVYRLRSGRAAPALPRAAASPAAGARADGVAPAPAGGPVPEPADGARADAPAEEPAGWPAERELLLAENGQLREQLDDLLNWMLTHFKGRYPVPESLMGRLQLASAGEDYRLSPETVAFLRISPEEEARIGEAFRYARALVELAEQRVMRVELNEADKAVVHVPAFAEAGEAVREWLMEAFETTLGSARSSRLATVSRDSLAERFGHFGAAERTIRFELTPGPDGPQLKIHDEWRLPGDLPGGYRIAATEQVVDGLPDRYLPYLSRLAETTEVTR